MSEFKEYKISELGKIGRGRSRHRPRNDEILYNGKYPFVQTGDVKKANFYLTKHTATYNDVGLEQSKLWDKNTLCITIAANIADTAILKYPACFPDSIIGFQPYKDKSDVRFIKYYFDIYKRHMESISMGATQNNLSVAKLESLKFHVPSLKVQENIANVLSIYDKLIENNNRRIEVLEQRIEEIYKEWFVRMRFPGYQDTKFDKGIPEGWEVRKVNELVDRFRYGILYKKEDVDEEGKVIVIDQSEKEFLGYHNETADHYADLNNPFILFGDHSCKMLVMTKPFSLSENVIPFKSKDESPELFLYYTVKDLVTTTEYKRHWVELTSKKVLIPELSLQLHFEKTIKNNFKLIHIYKQEKRNLIKQRDLLLPRLMNGTIKVK